MGCNSAFKGLTLNQGLPWPCEGSEVASGQIMWSAKGDGSDLVFAVAITFVKIRHFL